MILRLRTLRIRALRIKKLGITILRIRTPSIMDKLLYSALYNCFVY
jgi:hypothetical protein